LLRLPISDKELAYKSEKGGAALELLLQENDIDIYDFERKCVIENPRKKLL
jgi:hypothetical protein